MNVYMFQKDLRIHDQPLLKKAIENGPTIGLFIVEPYELENNEYGFLKRGLLQRQFMFDSLKDLKENLSSYNIPLLTVIGTIISVFESLSKFIDIDTVYYETLLGSEERSKYYTLKQLGLKTETASFHTLYHVNDVPYTSTNIPKTFTTFRKTIESLDCIRDLESISKQDIINKSLPHWWIKPKDLNIEDVKPTYVGGENEAIRRLDYYFFQSKKVGGYKFTRNGMLKKDDSTKFSPYLAWGNLSPRYIYHQLKYFEKKHYKNISTYWVYFELLWRDYFNFVHQAYGDLIFSKCGLKTDCSLNHDDRRINAWKGAKTGFSLIDANIKELLITGFMSNRGRQNVANFFTKQLKQDWRIGAAFFESYLIDFDVSSNTLNWLYNAGLGNDPREDRMFNVITQGKRYDEKGDYALEYLPELLYVPDKKRYDIPFFSNEERTAYGIDDYPKPIIKPWGKR